MQSQKVKNKKIAFTLIELLVVIAVIGLLSTIAIASFAGARSKARDARRISDLKNVSMMLDLYYDKYEYYPSLLAGETCPETGLNNVGWARLQTELQNAGILTGSLPIDPSQTGNNGYIYCSDGRVGLPSPHDRSYEYVLRATLENSSSPALSNDQDGNFFTADISNEDPACADGGPYYCVSYCREWAGHEGPANISSQTNGNCGSY